RALRAALRAILGGMVRTIGTTRRVEPTINDSWRYPMMTKIVLAAALTFGAASVALASGETDHEGGGFRSLANGSFVTDGVNPAYHRSLQGVRACETHGKTAHGAHNTCS